MLLVLLLVSRLTMESFQILNTSSWSLSLKKVDHMVLLQSISSDLLNFRVELPNIWDGTLFLGRHPFKVSTISLIEQIKKSRCSEEIFRRVVQLLNLLSSKLALFLQSTGELKELWLPLKIKAIVDHAGPFLPQVPLKVIILSRLVSLFLFLNHSLLTVTPLTMVVMVETKQAQWTTQKLILWKQRLHILTLQRMKPASMLNLRDRLAFLKQSTWLQIHQSNSN